MSTLNHVRLLALVSVLSLAAGCGSSGSSDDDGVKLVSAVQDLTQDPDGQVTVLTFSGSPGAALPANFITDGPATAVGVASAGKLVTVTWDDRVSPSHRVRTTGLSRVSSGWAPVATTNAAAPTFAVTSANQVAGLGGDTITVQFAGPNVVEDLAEDLSNWQLRVSGTVLDLTGSTFSLNTGTQVLTITTGPDANLHAAFDLAATGVFSVADTQVGATPVVAAATGDVTAPTLASAEQNLSEDEFGRVIDFTFSEAMDPVFSTASSNFTMTSPDFATSIEQPSAEVLRVTFNNPVVPGVDRVSLRNLVDAHGNDFPMTLQAISAGTTVANAFNGSPTLITVANAGSDYIQADFVQAIDPDDAVDWNSWEVEAPTGGGVLDLSGSTVTFDLATKRLRIDDLPVDNANGTSFTLRGAVGNEPHDVDGQLFTQSFAGTLSGETTLPTVSQVVQNRNQDPTGQTLDVQMSEDVDLVSSETVGNWAVTGGANVVAAVRQAGQDIVRLTLDAPVVPGDDTVSISGVADLAGNTVLPTMSIPTGSTDVTAPSMTVATAAAIEGANDDMITVAFDDDMIQLEVETPASWEVESPVGTMLDTSNATITYNSGARTATLTFDGGDGINLKNGDDFEVRLTSMRDLGGNTVDGTVMSGDIQAESNLPALASVWVESGAQNEVHVRFSEPCDHLDDLAGLTLYTVRDAGSNVRGYPSSAAVDADGMGVELVFGFSVVSGSDTLDIHGVTDLAGNYLFPVAAAPIAAEDAAAPALVAATSTGTTVSGEANDSVTVAFDRPLSTFGYDDPANWSLEQAGNPVDLSNASFSYDGNVTVTIDFDANSAPSLQTGLGYDVSVSNLSSAQGVAMVAPSLDSFTAAGDALPPTLPAGRTRLDAASPADTVLIEMDEALDPTDAVNVTLIDVNGGANPDTAQLLGRRTVRAYFSGGLIATDTINVNLRDLAGNLGATSRAVDVADSAGPLVSSVSGLAVEGRGLDEVHVVFSEPVDLSTGLALGNYGLTHGGNPIDLTGASASYESGTNTVKLRLPVGQDLQPGVPLTVDVANVTNHGGLSMNPPASVGGTVSGDATAPDFVQAFANYREDFSGVVIDVLFDEDVDEAFAADESNWTVSGGQTVLQVEVLSGRMFRLTLDQIMNASESLDLVGLPDLAGNLSGAITTVPTL